MRSSPVLIAVAAATLATALLGAGCSAEQDGEPASRRTDGLERPPSSVPRAAAVFPSPKLNLPPLRPAPRLPSLAAGIPPRYTAEPLPPEVQGPVLGQGGEVYCTRNEAPADGRYPTRAAVWRAGQGLARLPAALQGAAYGAEDPNAPWPVQSVTATAGSHTLGHVQITYVNAHITVYGHAALWDGGRVRVITGFPDTYSVHPTAINRHGAFVGTMGESNVPDPGNAFFFATGMVYDLGPGEPEDVSDRGLIVGSVAVPNGPSSGTSEVHHAAVWGPNRLRDLGPGAAHAVNNRGQVVGETKPPKDVWGRYRAFLHESGRRWGLNMLPRMHSTSARDINDRGQIVGHGLTDASGSEQRRALLWHGGRPYILDELLAAPVPEMPLEEGRAINERGQILCSSGRGEAERYLLLTPASRGGT